MGTGWEREGWEGEGEGEEVRDVVDQWLGVGNGLRARELFVGDH